MAEVKEIAAFVRGASGRLVAEDDKAMTGIRAALAHIARKNPRLIHDFPGNSVDLDDEATKAAKAAVPSFGGSTPTYGALWIVNSDGEPIGDGVPEWLVDASMTGVKTIGPVATDLDGQPRATLFYRSGTAAPDGVAAFAIHPDLLSKAKGTLQASAPASGGESDTIPISRGWAFAVVAAALALLCFWNMALFSGQTTRATLEIVNAMGVDASKDCKKTPLPILTLNQSELMDSQQIKDFLKPLIGPGGSGPDCRKLASSIALELAAKLRDSPVSKAFESSVRISEWQIPTAYTRAFNSIGRIDLSWLIVLHWVALTGLAIALGKATRGHWLGIIINSESKKASLSRLQGLAWTIVILGAFFGFTAFNIGTSSGSGVGGVFPDLDFTHWALLLGAGGVTALTAHFEKTQDPNGERLAKNVSVKDAAVLDLFSSQDVQGGRAPDIARLQNLAITVFLVAAVSAQLLDYAHSVAFVDMIPASAEKKKAFAALPTLSNEFLGLLGLSHVGYLGTKFYGLAKKPS
jgi:hypothetical protein